MQSWSSLLALSSPSATGNWYDTFRLGPNRKSIVCSFGSADDDNVIVCITVENLGSTADHATACEFQFDLEVRVFEIFPTGQVDRICGARGGWGIGLGAWAEDR
jgi:hypothetical protein